MDGEKLQMMMCNHVHKIKLFGFNTRYQFLAGIKITNFIAIAIAINQGNIYKKFK